MSGDPVLLRQWIRVTGVNPLIQAFEIVKSSPLDYNESSFISGEKDSDREASISL